MICSTVTEKLDRELFTTSILFTFFQTFPGGLERDVTMARHIGISFANICSSAQALVYDSLLNEDKGLDYGGNPQANNTTVRKQIDKKRGVLAIILC